MLPDVGAQSVDGLASLKLRQVCFESAGEHAPLFVAAMHPLARGSGLLEIRGIDTVGVNQATEQEAHQQAD